MTYFHLGCGFNAVIITSVRDWQPAIVLKTGGIWRPVSFSNCNDVLTYLSYRSNSSDFERNLRSCLAGEVYDVSRISHDQLLMALASSLVGGRLYLYENSFLPQIQSPLEMHGNGDVQKERSGAGSSASSGPAKYPVRAAAPVTRSYSPAKAQVKHWIEIELRGEDFSPVAGEQFKVRLPNHAFVEGYLDKNGLGRIDDIVEPGDCAISFTRLDQDAWAPTQVSRAPDFPILLANKAKKKFAVQQHLVQGDENVHSIAFQAGHLWSTIWNAPENDTLRTIRTDPSVLAAKDSLFIPDLRLRQEIGVTDKRHCFKRIGVPSVLRFRPMFLGELFVDQPYLVKCDSAEAGRGVTTDQGIVECYVTPDAKAASITIGTGYFRFTYQISLRTLAPVETMEGAVERLRQLGYFESDKSTAQAIAAFRDHHGMPQGDALDEEALRTLVCDFGR